MNGDRPAETSAIPRSAPAAEHGSHKHPAHEAGPAHAQTRRQPRTARAAVHRSVTLRDPRDRDDRRIVVWVFVTASIPDDEDRIHQRGEFLIQETLNQLLR
jgi:hypothetical protein